jgi:hypothetical protein
MTQAHRWAVVAISVLDEDQAAELHGIDLMDRMDELAGVLTSGRLETVRGPICTECRVHWRDVFAQPDKPWPCPGKRPAGLGGPLAPPETRKPRQQRRAEQRQAVKKAQTRSGR